MLPQKELKQIPQSTNSEKFQNTVNFKKNFQSQLKSLEIYDPFFKQPKLQNQQQQYQQTQGTTDQKFSQPPNKMRICLSSLNQKQIQTPTHRPALKEFETQYPKTYRGPSLQTTEFSTKKQYFTRNNSYTKLMDTSRKHDRKNDSDIRFLSLVTDSYEQFKKINKNYFQKINNGSSTRIEQSQQQIEQKKIVRSKFLQNIYKKPKSNSLPRKSQDF